MKTGTTITLLMAAGLISGFFLARTASQVPGRSVVLRIPASVYQNVTIFSRDSREGPRPVEYNTFFRRDGAFSVEKLHVGFRPIMFVSIPLHPGGIKEMYDSETSLVATLAMTEDEVAGLVSPNLPPTLQNCPVALGASFPQIKVCQDGGKVLGHQVYRAEATADGGGSIKMLVAPRINWAVLDLAESDASGKVWRTKHTSKIVLGDPPASKFLIPRDAVVAPMSQVNVRFGEKRGIDCSKCVRRDLDSRYNTMRPIQ